MLLSNKKGWQILVYRLLYPGVLGSMIFDLLDPLRPRQLASLGLLFIGGAFVIDFLHMTVDLEAEESGYARPSLDTAIAVLFCFAYFALTKVTAVSTEQSQFPFYCRVSLLWLALAYASIYYYEFGFKVPSNGREWNLLLLSLVSLAGLATVFFGSCDAVLVTVITAFLSCIVYFGYVFVVAASVRSVERGSQADA